MGRRSRATRVAKQLATVSARRLVRGPRQPGWSLQYEVLLAYLREAFMIEAPIAKTRKTMDRMGDVELKRARVRWTDADVDGVRGAWAEAEGADDRVILYLHGGGYFFGSIDSHRGLIAEIALATGARVLAIDYRLAPEHPCPAAIEDVARAAAWLLAGEVEPHQLTLAGDSAGGGLTLSTLMHLRDAGLPSPSRGFMLSPWLDLSMTPVPSHAFTRDDYLGSAERLTAHAKHYIGGLQPTDPRVSPLFGDLRGLPPLLVIAGGAEVLRDDSVRLAERAREAGAELRLVVEPGEVHVYPALIRFSPRGRFALERIARFLR